MKFARGGRLLLLAGWIGVWVGCSRNDGAATWLGAAEQANESATEALAQGDSGAARAALLAAVEAPPPSSVPDRDARVVRQDLYYRLALVDLASGAPEHAESWAAKGLALGEERDVFVANLYIVRGRAREARGNEVKAARDYHHAISISENLLDEALGSNEGK